jgi:hypothetical protein
MPLKFKIIFYNLMIFLVLFDIIYLSVWIFSIEMNPIKAVIVAGVTILLMPWARATHYQTGRKVAIRSLAYDFYINVKSRKRNNHQIR